MYSLELGITYVRLLEIQLLKLMVKYIYKSNKILSSTVRENNTYRDALDIILIHLGTFVFFKNEKRKFLAVKFALKEVLHEYIFGGFNPFT